MGTVPENFKGKKGRSGRKTTKEELAGAIELITQESLINLANSKVYKQLIKIKEGNLSGFKDTRDMALPITLKGMIERKDLTSGGKPIPLLQGIVKSDDSDNSTPKAITTDKTD